ncbi:MAG: type II secretion system protein [Pirellulaceae bacterium]|nr:type II secretion system protein [Planctomycetales bacterium]
MMKRTNQQQQQQRRRCHTAGMTLVELLVVVAIIVGVLAVLLPLAKPLIDGRDVREASRQVNAYLAAAQARAIGTGKPVGVFFTRQGTDPAQVNKVYQMELMTSPVLYAGPTENARAFMENFLPKPITVAGTVITVPCASVLIDDPQLLVPVEYDPTNPSVVIRRWVDRGDTIRFQNRKPDYEIVAIELANPSTPTKARIWFTHAQTTGPAAPVATQFPPNNPATKVFPGLSFQIQRRPRRSAANPLELPVGAYIDLTYSGAGAGGYEFQAGPPPAIPLSVSVIFSPHGGVERVYLGNEAVDVSAPLHFLIVRDKPEVTSVVNGPLLAAAGSIWVTVEPLVGKVSTSENLGYDPTLTLTLAEQLALARSATREAQNMGGR